MINRLLLSTLAWAIATPLLAAEAPWVDNFEAAKKTAATEGKDLFIDFTGSDWCSWCIKLHKEVFDLEAFKTNAPKNFVLVELDFPRDKSKLPKELQEQNAQLQKQFAVQGFPTILLADASGRPYARTGYRPNGPEEYIKNLDHLRDFKAKRDEAWKQAASATGVEKAKLLAAGLNLIGVELAMRYYQPEIAQLKAADPNDETGVIANFKLWEDLMALPSKVAATAKAGDAGAARKEVDDFIAARPKLNPPQKQAALMALLNTFNPAKDDEPALKLLEEIKVLDPESPAGIKAQGIIQAIQKQKSAPPSAPAQAPSATP